MTRSRAAEDGVVGDLTATHYGQRASACLIVTEGVFPTANGKGGVGTPGMEPGGQEVGWKSVAQAVNDTGGRIVNCAGAGVVVERGGAQR
jgi:N-ethylmaleimide reductase